MKKKTVKKSLLGAALAIAAAGAGAAWRLFRGKKENEFQPDDAKPCGGPFVKSTDDIKPRGTVKVSEINPGDVILEGRTNPKYRVVTWTSRDGIFEYFDPETGYYKETKLEFAKYKLTTNTGAEEPRFARIVK